MACLPWALGLIGLLAPPPPPLAIHVEPAHPRQGDTLSVFVTGTLGSTPTISSGTARYPAFALGDDRYRAFVPLSPLDHAGPRRITAEAGKTHVAASVTVAARKFGVQRITLPPGVSVELDPIERARVAAVKALATPEKKWTGVFRAPAGGRLSSPYGVRRYRNGVFLTDYYHRGIDLAPGAGAPVVAPAGGRVVLAGIEKEGFRVHGNVVGVDHGQGVLSLMLHLSRILVHEGDTVQAGDPIGLVGATGAAKGPHLHWGLYVNGIAVDPEPWLHEAID
jgi:murein DD-endopeptidase MepM/ murein hydrolase activator NlpD